MTAWNLYLDDVRMPPPTREWTIARTVEEARRLIQALGPPVYCSLDHDMGLNYCRPCAFRDAEDPCYSETGTNCDCSCHTPAPSGYDLLVWIQDTGNWPLVKPSVHSANPIGSLRMRQFIEDYGQYDRPTS